MDPVLNEDGTPKTPAPVVAAGGTALTEEGLARMLAEADERSAASTRELIQSEIKALNQPDPNARGGAPLGSTEHPAGGASDIRTSMDIARGVAVSRIQPLDYFYRKMDEETQLWRSPESDHWGAQFIRAQLSNETGLMKEAYDKSEEWVTRAFGRAAGLEGTPGASGAISAGTLGPAIPRPLEEMILISRDRASTMRRFARPFVMSKQTHTIPTAATMTFAMAGETSTGTEGSPTHTSVQMSAKPGTVKAYVGIDALDDLDLNLMTSYNELAGLAIGAGEDVQFWSTGDGALLNISSKVDGTAYTEETSGVLAFIDVVQMQQALPQAYRRGAAWYAASDVVGFLSLLLDGNTRQFYQGLGDAPGLLNDDPDQVGFLQHRPIFEVPAPAGVIMYGDMRAAYTVGTRQNIESTSSIHAKFEERQVVWVWTTRFDGQDIDAVAMRRAAGITSATTSITPAP